MWLQDHIGVGTTVERVENPAHVGRVILVDGSAPQVKGRRDWDSAVYRVLWNCGWREDCDRGEIQRRFA